MIFFTDCEHLFSDQYINIDQLNRLKRFLFVIFMTRLPPAERRGYKSVFDALFRIVQEEGVVTLWRVSELRFHHSMGHFFAVILIPNITILQEKQSQKS